MMAVIGDHLGMLVAMWIVMILVGLEALIFVLTSLRGQTDMAEVAKAVTRPVLLDLLPLILLSLLTLIDHTGVLVRIWFYVAAAAIAIRALMALARGLQRRV
ncbi:hypothetical protein LLE49_15885 [Alicyclobacillus tolerans]|uniref:hypothetical protein n=1 Tax=Alicyclobacillus tolerans TaxID=90970 RepID=UPI001F33A0AE|nr:hypothetical protein [Alicyclobacillus tolerans]MCF8566207.1 hypothetical protein [Alicyclobacillus tolerans]